MMALEALRAILPALDYASVAVFALTGALVASRAQLDVVGFIFIACLTATGGGTLRDLLLDRQIFWMTNSLALAIAAVAAILVFFTAHLLEDRFRAIQWLDALALAGSGCRRNSSCLRWPWPFRRAWPRRGPRAWIGLWLS